jgi:diguanylate cyclase (GGDEF)-like protein/PAS domain S-box-containing protein
VLRDDEGHLTGLLGITRDITAERKLRQELMTRSVAVDSAAEGVVVTDASGVIEYANPAFCDMTGYTLEEVKGQPTRRFKSGVHDKDFYRELWGTITAGKPWRGEVVNRRKDGMLYHELLTIAPVKDEQGNVVRFVAIKHDISERKRIEQRLEHLAHFDLLTDLPNRTLFFDRLQQAFFRAQRYQEGLAVLMLDLDGFKAVNDSLGHQAGDLLLAAFAYRLKQTLRQSDTAARMGGDEFTILLHGIRQQDDAVIAARKILDALVQPFDILGHPCHVGASIGVAQFHPDYGSAEALLQAADAAMYEAKRHGKNRWVVAAPASRQESA